MGDALSGTWSCDHYAAQPRDNQQGYGCPAHVGTLSFELRKFKAATLSKLMFSDPGPLNVATCVNVLELSGEP